MPIFLAILYENLSGGGKMKILFAAMSLGFGGAETHILELSRELVRRGHTVFVASEGGVFERALTDGGAVHIYAPLCKKDPESVRRSKKTLAALIERERFDIVHAHARIPAYICGALQKKYGFVFVTTAHFDFKVNPLLKRITNWGDFVFSVSDDIAENLIKNYSYPRERVALIRNGIDTEKFSPNVSGEAVRERYGLGTSPVAMYLGRLDDDSFLPAKCLTEAAFEISRTIPGIKIVIVGKGKNLDILKAQGEAVNKKTGRETVVFTGPTSDAASFTAACDVFFGPSRSAMEALAMGKPTVVAGTFGRLGLFSEKTEKEALRTNFCARESALPTPKTTAADIISALSLTDEKREELSCFGREFIKKNYSVAAMADVCENKYRDLLCRGKRVVICGYYGYSNAGDEAMLGSLVASLREGGSVGDITVMSASPEKTAEKYGVNAIDRFNITAVKKALANADVMIFGGGNILQDKTSTHSLIYYTSVINAAKKHGLALALVANGIGPITKKSNIARVKKALRCCDYISLRDVASANFVRELLPEKNIHLTSDLVCLSESGTTKKGSESRFFAVCPKKIKGFSINVLADFCAEMKKKYSLTPRFFAMHEGEDSALCERLSALCGGEVYRGNVGELLFESEFSVCMRLHGAVFSLVEKCPMLAVSDDGKMSAFLSSLGIPECAFFPPEVSSSDLFVAAKRILESRADVRDALAFEASKHRENIAEEMKRLAEFIKGTT